MSTTVQQASVRFVGHISGPVQCAYYIKYKQSIIVCIIQIREYRIEREKCKANLARVTYVIFFPLKIALSQTGASQNYGSHILIASTFYISNIPIYIFILCTCYHYFYSLVALHVKHNNYSQSYLFCILNTKYFITKHTNKQVCEINCMMQNLCFYHHTIIIIFIVMRFKDIPIYQIPTNFKQVI